MDPSTALRAGSVALFRHVPQVRVVPWAVLGDWPTPIEPAPRLGAVIGGEVWIKREDLSSPHYGGNKVRTLEAVFGAVKARGVERIWATGAYGSNHTVATAIHAPRVGLDSGAILFPQPASEPAQANLRALVAAGVVPMRIPTIALLPAAMAYVARRERRTGTRAFVMAPGGATVEGAFGGLSAAFELADQIDRGVAPAPAQILLAVGSGATTAGLLAGVHLAAARGLGFKRPPLVVSVRVTPWPVTAPWRLAVLASRVAARVDRLRGHDSGLDARLLRAHLVIDGHEFGGGYGRVTPGGVRATAAFAEAGGPALDAVYSAKSASALWRYARWRSPTLFWATKSTAPLPDASPEQLARVHPHMRRWLDKE